MIYELDGSAPDPPPRRDPRIVAVSIAGVVLSAVLFLGIAGLPLPQNAASPDPSATPAPIERSLIAEPALQITVCYGRDGSVPSDTVPPRPEGWFSTAPIVGAEGARPVSQATLVPIQVAPTRTWSSERVVFVNCRPITLLPPSLIVPTR